MNSPVYIVLASYNGENYIETQLDSIVNQTYTDWKLLIRDDGSTDATMSIIKKYVQQDSRIELIDEYSMFKGNGAGQNFGALLSVAVSRNATMIMFCDQDDFWFPTKVEAMRGTMVNTQSAMVYSDFLYSDEHLNELPAEIQKAKSPYLFPFFKSTMVQNHVYGCTMMISGNLAKLCLPIPPVAENHDYWIALVASGVDVKIHHLSKPLMHYRQHANNVTGNVKDHQKLNRINRFLFSFDQLRQVQLKKNLMLGTLYEQLGAYLKPDNKMLLMGYLNALNKDGLSIVSYCIKHGIKRQSFVSTIVLYVLLSNMSQLKTVKR
jgi:rhamnosyltransferase